MMAWEEGESTRFCFIALTKVHPWCFFSPLASATRSPTAFIIILEGLGVLFEALRSAGHAT